MEKGIKINHIYCGDAKAVLQEAPNECIDMCMTSPPYWALRDYGRKKQLGLEPDFNEYINKLCDVFDEVKRILKPQGTCWVNLGDTYYTKSSHGFQNDKLNGNKSLVNGLAKAQEARGKGLLPNKCLSLIPLRFAIEMVKRGWILRNIIIWHKPNCMPSSVKDRFTVDFEYVFFFSKNKKYYFNKQYEPLKQSSIKRLERAKKSDEKFDERRHKKDLTGKTQPAMKIIENSKFSDFSNGRNKRCVWRISTTPFHGQHFAVYPEALCEIPIKAGCPKKGIVLDPFFGAGTTGLVAVKQNKNFVGIDLNPSYIRIAERRIKDGIK